MTAQQNQKSTQPDAADQSDKKHDGDAKTQPKDNDAAAESSPGGATAAEQLIDDQNLQNQAGS